jgi:hypothetical protein
MESQQCTNKKAMGLSEISAKSLDKEEKEAQHEVSKREESILVGSKTRTVLL